MSLPQSHPQSPGPVPTTPTRRIFAQPAPRLQDHQWISSPQIAINMRRFRKSTRPKSSGRDDDLDELNSPTPATSAPVNTRLTKLASMAPQSPSLHRGSVLSPTPSTPLSAVKRRRTEPIPSGQHPLAGVLSEAIEEPPLRKAARSDTATLLSVLAMTNNQPISAKSPHADIHNAKVRHSIP